MIISLLQVSQVLLSALTLYVLFYCIDCIFMVENLDILLK